MAEDEETLIRGCSRFRNVKDIKKIRAENVDRCREVRAENVGRYRKVRAENVGRYRKVRAENVIDNTGSRSFFRIHLHLRRHLMRSVSWRNMFCG